MNENLTTEKTLLQCRITLEIAITEREAMLAANAAREHRGEVQAYPEEEFRALAKRLVSLAEFLCCLR